MHNTTRRGGGGCLQWGPAVTIHNTTRRGGGVYSGGLLSLYRTQPEGGGGGGVYRGGLFTVVSLEMRLLINFQ